MNLRDVKILVIMTKITSKKYLDNYYKWLTRDKMNKNRIKLSFYCTKNIFTIAYRQHTNNL